LQLRSRCRPHQRQVGRRELVDAVGERIDGRIHVAEAHHRELPKVVRLAAANETDPDTRILNIAARGSHVAAEPSPREEVATITAG
jgi:hypothetical protein